MAATQAVARVAVHERDAVYVCRLFTLENRRNRSSSPFKIGAIHGKRCSVVLLQFSDGHGTRGHVG